jgi:hypothetical protein
VEQIIVNEDRKDREEESNGVGGKIFPSQLLENQWIRSEHCPGNGKYCYQKF